jgi:DNA-binding MarR family transcriptional regulator
MGWSCRGDDLFTVRQLLAQSRQLCEKSQIDFSGELTAYLMGKLMQQSRSGKGRAGDFPLEQDSFRTSVLYWIGMLEVKFNREFVHRIALSKTIVPRWRTLSVLADLDGLTINELARHTFIERSALSRLLTLMAREGLVRSRLRAADKRNVEVFITAKGRAAFRHMLPIRRAVFRQAAAGLSQRAIVDFVRMVRAMISNLDAAERKPPAAVRARSAR